MSIYASVPLKPARREIRLLSLSPGHGEDPIEAHLYRASLDAKPIYSVLSYAWGSDNDHATIKVQDEDFQVTRNLQQCLMKLRHETDPLIIWIDAICIHQESVQEKNTYVPLMKDIYQQAQKLFVWLGESSNELDLLFTSVRNVSSYEEGFKYEDLESIGHGLDASPEEILAACSKFFGLPWWRRTWIIQEFALPRQDPSFVCGNHRMPWKNLQKWWETIREANGTVREHHILSQMNPSWAKLHKVLSAQPIQHLSFVRTLLSDPERLEQGLPISVLINISEKSLATDARDKVYGIMGLAHSNAREKIRVDYNQSVEGLYEEVSRYLICEENKLNILSNQSRDIEWKGSSVENTSPQQQLLYSMTWGEKAVGSWIRDFTHVSSSWTAAPLLHDWHRRGAFYDASYGTLPLVDLEQRPGELAICGMELGVVKECARAWHLVPGMMQHFCTWDAVLPVFFNAAQSLEDNDRGKEKQADDDEMALGGYDWSALYRPQRGSSKSIREAIWRTVIGDRLHPGRSSAPAFCGTFFSGLMQAHFSDTMPSITLSEGVTSLEEALELWSKFQTRVDDMLFRRSAFRTADGWIGLAPDHVEEGDVIVILSGGDVPFVLRPWDDGWYLVGECYVEGVMDGEMIEAHVKTGSVPGKLYRIR